MSDTSKIEFMAAARVPYSLRPQTFGLWGIRRVPARNVEQLNDIGWTDYTILHHMTEATMHQDLGEIVMEDSVHELRKHLPIWLSAHGRVLNTGLGLGCVVRGLLASQRVEHIDVVEIDADIIRVVGAEFADNSRVTIHHADALEFDWPPGTRWDCAWHDLWCEDNKELHFKHVQLLANTKKRCRQQGAWMLPPIVGRIWDEPLLGTKRRKSP
jgi:hypothetical protein